MIGGQAQTAIPYPKISDEDWQKWKAFLPVKSVPFCKYKDPIALGITGNGERHLICRWGKDKLIPFESIKSRSWLYHVQNFGLILLASKEFWLSTVGAAVIGILYFAVLLHP